MDKQASRGYLSEKAGFVVPEGVADGFVADSIRSKPHLAELFKRYCRRKSVDRGQLVRTRAAWRYSTVFMQYDVLGAPAANWSADLYAIPLSGVDPVIGLLGENFTNVLQAGRMDSDQQFVATHMGFTVEVISPPTAAEENTEATVNLEQFWGSAAARFLLGTETEQIWGPVRNCPYPKGTIHGNIDHLAANSAGQTRWAYSVGYKDLFKLEPEVVLGAGQAARVRLTVPAPALPVDVVYADAIVAITHFFYGRTRTAITG
jgi:hypothetical protein